MSSEPKVIKCILYQDILVPEDAWEHIKRWLLANGWFIVDENGKGYIMAISPLGIPVRFYKVSKK